MMARVSEEGGWAVRYPGKKCQSLGTYRMHSVRWRKELTMTVCVRLGCPVCSIGLPIFLKLLLEVKKAQGQVPRADVGQPGLQPLFSHFLEMGS